MKKFLQITLCALILVAAAVAVYRFVLRKSISDAPVAQQVQMILQKNDCFVCHTSSPEISLLELVPHIGEMMAEDRQRAVDFIDLEAKFGGLESGTANSIDEVTLSKVEYAVAYKTMPLKAYRMAHWGTGLNSKERRILASWIMDMRGGKEAITPILDTIAFDAAKAELGERMFNDMRISLDGTINCATCHVLENGGADHADERVSVGINDMPGTVNAPTVYNSSFNIKQFWNGRAADLQEQATGPATNPVEMGDQTWEQIVARLSEDKALVKEFEALYPDEGLTEYTVTSAIAEFERKLVTPDSRFDHYLKGDVNAMSAKEIAGYEAFKANACICCHTGVILGGKSFEKLGIHSDYFTDRTQRKPDVEYVADDNGLKSFTGNDADMHRFKTPGLRNVALTAPYFHDGTYQTLEEAVKAMARFELGKELSETEITNLVAFMKSLTGRNPYLKQ